MRQESPVGHSSLRWAPPHLHIFSKILMQNHGLDIHFPSSTEVKGRIQVPQATEYSQDIGNKRPRRTKVPWGQLDAEQRLADNTWSRRLVIFPLTHWATDLDWPKLKPALEQSCLATSPTLRLGSPLSWPAHKCWQLTETSASSCVVGECLHRIAAVSLRLGAPFSQRQWLHEKTQAGDNIFHGPNLLAQC